MKNFLLGFGIGIGFCFLVAAVLFFGLMAAISVGQPQATVGENSALVLDLTGGVPERPPVDLGLPFLGEQDQVTVVENWQLMRKAASDPRIKGLVVAPRGLGVGWAKLEELRAQVVKFKESGKPVYAYLRGGGAPEYYVATAADQIFMAPDDWLDVKGLRAELMFLRNTLDKVGVAMEFEGIGLYKDAPDTFTETSPSPQTLEVTNQILDQYFGNLVNVIAEGRKRDPAAIRAAIDQGPFVGKSAVDAGLIDEMLFEDDVFKRMEQQLGSKELAHVHSKDYSKVSVSGDRGGARIAVVVGDGEILPSGTDTGFDDAGMTAAGMARTLKQVREDSSIQGVIVRVDSPGGDAIASAEILHEVQALSAKKPTLISMSDYAASGGYMMAMSGDPVLAYSNTLTGSIGVFFGKLTLRSFYDKIGLNKYLLTRGRWAAIDSDYTPLGPAERQRLQQELRVYYRGFVERVAAGRKKPYDTIEPLAQGRVWLGAQAKNNGLVDEIGGFDRAIEMIKDKAQIPASERVSLVTFPARRTLLEVLMNRPETATGLESAIDKVFGKLPWRSLTSGSGVVQLMPYGLEVK